MPDRLRSSPSSAAGFSYLASYRRSKVNPGDRKTPTDYYVYGKAANVGTGTATSLTYHPLTGWQDATSSFNNASYGPGGISPYVWTGHDQYNTNELAPSGHPDYLEGRDVALAKLHSFVRDAKRSDFNAAIFAAEAGKSIEMIGSAASRLYQAYRDFRRGDIPDAFSTLAGSPHGRKPGSRRSRGHRPANNWLEYKYGWMPLYNDIYNGARKVASLVLNEDPIYSIRARSTHQRDGSLVYGDQLPGSRYGTEVFSDSLRVQVGVSYSMGSYAMTQAASLGLTNPALVVWELVPLSFVFDWFLPVGNFLESLSTFTGLKFHSGYISAKRVRTVQFSERSRRLITSYGEFPGGNWGITAYTQYSGCSYSYKDWSFTRGRLLDFPSLPVPRVQMPQKWHQAVSALSLFRQRMR